jgi:hypothetical protein
LTFLHNTAHFLPPPVVYWDFCFSYLQFRVTHLLTESPTKFATSR